MSSQTARHLRLLTWFLGAAGVATAVAILVGPALRDGEPAAGPAQPRDTATTVATTTTAASVMDTTVAPEPTTTVAPAPLDAASVEREIAPSVAFITTFNGTGSGVLVTEDLVLTNAHVVWPFSTVGVLFGGDSRRTGRVVGIDPRADLAFVQVDSPRLPPPIPFGSSRELDAGSQLFVVGFPGAVEFTPDPTVDSGAFSGVRVWEFSGVDWVVTEAPAIGGQSGGALVDEYGRLVGITTFGSPATVYSVTIEDIAVRLDLLNADGLPDLADRRPPRSGGRLSHDIDLEGPWEQAAFVTWLSPGVRTELSGSTDVSWRALDPYGLELGRGDGALDVFWPLATPGIVLGESAGTSSTVQATRPMIVLPDPDDARALGADGLEGFVDVPGDRDWFYLEVEAQAGVTTIVVEAQTRVRISLYDRASRRLIAEVEHERGFFFEDPALVVEELAAGSYVVAIEDIAAQFGMYSIRVE